MKPWLGIAAWAGLVILLDQATKIWLSQSLTVGQSVVLTPWLNLVHWQNPGTAFGMMSGSGLGWLVKGLSVLGLVVLLAVAARLGPASAVGRMGLGWAVGGAVGNLIDRARLGQVIDFLDFHWAGHHWPAFNVADAALSGGFILIALVWLKRT